MLKKLIIKEKAKFKEGKSATGPWTLWNLKDTENNKYSSFDDLPLDTELELECTEETYKKKDGTEGKSQKLSYPKKPKGVDPQVINDIREDMKVLKQRMDFVEIRLGAKERLEKPQDVHTDERTY